MIGELINLVTEIIKRIGNKNDNKYPWVKLKFDEVSGWAIHQARKRRKYFKKGYFGKNTYFMGKNFYYKVYYRKPSEWDFYRKRK